MLHSNKKLHCILVIIISVCKPFNAGSNSKPQSSTILPSKYESLLVPTNRWKELSCECGVLGKDVGWRKVNKLMIKRGELPWLVSISAVKKNQSYRDRVHLCSGSLINFLYVVTSADCVNELPKNTLRVELIGFHVNSSKLIKIQSVKLHPRYRKGQDNGVALLKLASYIKTSTAAVPICLPSVLKRNITTLDHAKSPSFKDILVKRWIYRKSQDSEIPRTPIYAQINVKDIDADNCSTLYPSMLKSKTLCIKPQDPSSVLAKHREDFFCFIEPGLPLMKGMTQYPIRNGSRKSPVEKYFITGLSSIGSGCSTLGNFTENTNNLYNIEEYEPWIRDNSLDGLFCKY